MSERKPPRARFESMVDRQVREGIDRGDFENLPGTGKPIPGLGTTHDELWWVKQKLRREDVSILPPTLALRKEAEESRRAAGDAASELQARRILSEINEKIRSAIIRPVAGPPLNLAPLNIERIIEQWRDAHPAPPPTEDATPSVVATTATKPRQRPKRWWRRIGLRPRRVPPAPSSERTG